MTAQATLFESASTADISDCGRYRYRLGRRWGRGPTACFVCLNPSVASADVTDPTITRCIGFAQSWGHAALDVVNLFAWRSTDPHGLDVDDPVGPDNDAAIIEATATADLIVLAWGAIGRLPARVRKLAQARAAAVAQQLVMGDAHVLGTTQAGEPRHPLFVRGDAQPMRWGQA